LARSNYSYAKRQKELARQKKQEEKRLKKQGKAGEQQEGEATTGESALDLGRPVEEKPSEPGA